MIGYVLLAILLLGVLIGIHEFGHFISARLCGIAVKEFSFGFGPALLQRVAKSGTKFSLRLVPMGGYCMFYGDTDDDPDGLKQDDPRCYYNASVWKRLISVVCGPAMNLLLAFLIAFGATAAWGVVATHPYITEVTESSAASDAGLLPGDIFVSVDAQDVSAADPASIAEIITAAGEKNICFTVCRDGQNLTFDVTPRYNEEMKRTLVGVTMAMGYERIPAGQVLQSSFRMCTEASGAILRALGALVTTGEGFQDTTGPIGAVRTVAEYTQQYGIQEFFLLAVILSINLGLINLLPIPGLDGSRIVFMLIEAVRGKPVNRKTESIIHLCGYALLFSLMIFLTWRDVGNLFH